MSTAGKQVNRFHLRHILLVVLLAAGLLLVVPAMGEQVYAHSKVCKVTASSLYVRTDAGTEYKQIGSLKKGTYKVIEGSKKDSKKMVWYKVSLDSKKGYICSDYVDVISLPVTKVENLQGTVNVKSGTLKARSGPGSIYEHVGNLAKGKTFMITGKGKDVKGVLWYRTKLNGKIVFFTSKYVKTKKVEPTTKPTTKATTKSTSQSSTNSTTKATTTKPTTTQPASTTTETQSFTVVNVKDLQGTVATESGGRLNVRSGPGTDYEILGKLDNGATFTITGKVTPSKTVWYQLKFEDKTGYVSSNHVKTKTVSTTTAKQTSTTKATGTTTFTIGTINTTSSSLNVRSGAGVSYSKLGTIAKGTKITITGSAKATNGVTWYKYKFTSKKTGFICSKYVTTKKVKTDAAFEKYMTKQKFPESYKAGLRLLHAIHPNWTFTAYHVGCSWSTALNAETKNLGTNLVSKSDPVSYRSKAKGSYNSKTKKWTKFDGSWYAAKPSVVAYYMDPRNFLNEEGICQFMTHKFDADSQSKATVRSVIKGTFMETRATNNKTYKTFDALIYAAGKSAKVNPNVIASMIIQEQGTKGKSRLISGKCSGYKGYYNFFNIGAYTTKSMSAVERGLWYAKQEGKYGRPWNSIYKSIRGGALFYATNYVESKQDTYYYKKFNVKNGASRIGVHQYMTYVKAAQSEGAFLKKAFTANADHAAVIEIPVYLNMPADACPLE